MNQQTTELAKETDPLGHTTAYEYNDAGQLTPSKNALGHTTRYEYNNEGQLYSNHRSTGQENPSAMTLGRLTSVTDPLGHTTSQFMDAIGQVSRVTDPGGQRTIDEYDKDNQTHQVN